MFWNKSPKKKVVDKKKSKNKKNGINTPKKSVVSSVSCEKKNIIKHRPKLKDEVLQNSEYKQASKITKKSDIRHRYTRIFTTTNKKDETRFFIQEKVKKSLVLLQVSELEVVMIATDSFINSSLNETLRSRLLSRNISIISSHYSETGVIASFYEDLEAESKYENSEALDLFDNLAQSAISKGATDIHIIRESNVATIDMRIHGEISDPHEWAVIPTDEMCRVVYNYVAKIKQGNWDSFKGQDANIERIYGQDKFRFRYHHYPMDSSDSYHCVIRILPMERDEKYTALEDLGFSKSQSELIRIMVSQPGGSLIVAGVTGSGKSTAIKNIMQHMLDIHNNRIRILTVEDPPEYKIPGVIQSPVRRASSVNSAEDEESYSNTIKSAMRRDPDIVMVGEIRDKPTAMASVRACQSGHMLLTTIHANKALGIPARLEGLGIPRDVTGAPGFIKGLIYQSLLNKICPDCGIPLEEFDDEMMKRRIKRALGSGYEKIIFRNYGGCDHCKNGILGKTVVAEVLYFDERMSALVADAKDLGVEKHWRGLREQVKGNVGCEFEAGIGSMIYDHAIEKMCAGIVSPTEVEYKVGRILSADANSEDMLQNLAFEVLETIGAIDTSGLGIESHDLEK